MDTVLNLGLNDEVVSALIVHTNSSRFGLDTYRRFLQMYGTVVLGVPKTKYEEVVTKIKKDKGFKHDLELRTEDLKKIVSEFKELTDFPTDPWEQLSRCIEAVFSSWFSPRYLLLYNPPLMFRSLSDLGYFRACKYRQFNNIPENLGTAVTVQVISKLKARSNKVVVNHRWFCRLWCSAI